MIKLVEFYVVAVVATFIMVFMFLADENLGKSMPRTLRKLVIIVLSLFAGLFWPLVAIYLLTKLID